VHLFAVPFNRKRVYNSLVGLKEKLSSWSNFARCRSIIMQGVFEVEAFLVTQVLYIHYS
jgi:hypothetical protein